MPRKTITQPPAAEAKTPILRRALVLRSHVLLVPVRDGGFVETGYWEKR